MIQQTGLACSNAGAPNGDRMPRDLKLNEISGDVRLRITIDGAGNLTATIVVSSNTQPTCGADRCLQRHAARYKCQASGSTIIAEQSFVSRFEWFFRRSVRDRAHAGRTWKARPKPGSLLSLAGHCGLGIAREQRRTTGR